MIPALAILAGSMALDHVNDRKAISRQKRLASAMEAFQRNKAREATAATENLIKEQTPEARGTELASLARERAESMRDSVGAAQAFDAPRIAGKTGSDYQRAQEVEANRSAERTRRTIEQLAEMGAPGEQQLKHGLRHGRAAGTVDASNSAMERVGSAYASDIDSVKPDPFLALVSTLGRTVGTGMLLNAGAAASENAALDAGANFGQGYEDAAGNLYHEGVTTRPDANIQRRMNRAFSLWGRK